MRKENHTFYFSVEGQTEEMYLEWLQRKINTTPEAKCTVKFNTKIEKNPLSYIKSLTTIGKVEVTHIFDYESSDQQHKDLFLETLKNMKKATMLGKKIKYKLGYSNFTFELWMILHKTSCNTVLAHRRQYLSKINKSFGCDFQSLDDYKREDNFNKILESLTLDDVRQAVKRSKEIMYENEKRHYSLKKYSNYSYYEENPSLSVWEIIEEILSVCGLCES